jgi:hypothetical protein
MKKYLIIPMLMMISFDTVKTSHDGNEKVIVNMEMIRRFQEVKAEGDIYSWSQLIVKSDSRAIHEYILSYRNSDVNEQSLESIKLALEDKTREIESAPADHEEEYFANLIRIKKEISLKLGSGNQTAMK